MTEATGWEAVTIHRLLELSGVPSDDRSTASFERNEENPLEADVIIIDENVHGRHFPDECLAESCQCGNQTDLGG